MDAADGSGKPVIVEFQNTFMEIDRFPGMESMREVIKAFLFEEYRFFVVKREFSEVSNWNCVDYYKKATKPRYIRIKSGRYTKA